MFGSARGAGGRDRFNGRRDFDASGGLATDLSIRGPSFLVFGEINKGEGEWGYVESAPARRTSTSRVFFLLRHLQLSKINLSRGSELEYFEYYFQEFLKLEKRKYVDDAL